MVREKEYMSFNSFTAQGTLLQGLTLQALELRISCFPLSNIYKSLPNPTNMSLIPGPNFCLTYLQIYCPLSMLQEVLFS